MLDWWKPTYNEIYSEYCVIWLNSFVFIQYWVCLQIVIYWYVWGHTLEMWCRVMRCFELLHELLRYWCAVVHTSEFLLTSYVGLILHSTTVATTSRRTIKGTIRVLCSYCMRSSFSVFCHSSIRILSFFFSFQQGTTLRCPMLLFSYCSQDVTVPINMLSNSNVTR